MLRLGRLSVHGLGWIPRRRLPIHLLRRLSVLLGLIRVCLISRLLWRIRVRLIRAWVALIGIGHVEKSFCAVRLPF